MGGIDGAEMGCGLRGKEGELKTEEKERMIMSI